jgi:hypothetical protein
MMHDPFIDSPVRNQLILLSDIPPIEEVIVEVEVGAPCCLNVFQFLADLSEQVLANHFHPHSILDVGMDQDLPTTVDGTELGFPVASLQGT